MPPEYTLTALHTLEFPAPKELPAAPLFIWAHGWGHTHAMLAPLAESARGLGRHIVLDLPGFGQSPRPTSTWTTADYADTMAAFIRQQPEQHCIWVGHSFGCRVGLQLAARHPDLVDGLFLIAAAGLPRQRTLIQKAHIKLKVLLYKALKQLAIMSLMNKEKLARRFGSADYRQAGAIRDIFIATVTEDLTPVAQQVHCPVHLLYGAADTDTPPEIGQRFSKLIQHSQLTLLPGEDHHTVLGSARHQVLHTLKKFVATLPRKAA